MSQIFTTHNENGKAVFYSKISSEPKDFKIPLGTMNILYGTHQFPSNLSYEKDLEDYAHDKEHSWGPGVSCPPNGTSVTLLSMAPGLKSPMNRLPTLGYFYVLEGEVTLVLDSGESKKLKGGDSGALRGAMHSWSNDTPNEGWAKLLSFSQRTEPLIMNGMELEPGRG